MRTIVAMKHRIPEEITTTLIVLILANVAVLGPIVAAAYIWRTP